LPQAFPSVREVEHEVPSGFTAINRIDEWACTLQKSDRTFAAFVR